MKYPIGIQSFENSTFKAADADLQFVLLTGVTKFSQVSVFSGFNQPDDISLDDRYEALCGIPRRNYIRPLMSLSRRWQRDIRFRRMR